MDIKSILGLNKIFKTAKLARKHNVEKAGKVKRSDSVQLSGEAKRSAEVKKYINIVKNSSDVRPEKVKMARQKLKNGDYSKPEVFEKITQRLTEKFSIGDKILDSLGDKE